MHQAPASVVVGAGLAGLVASLRLRQAGHAVTLITKGIGGIQLGHGSFDVLGYAPYRVTDDPLGAVDAVRAADAHHPYALVDRETITAGFDYLRELLPGWFAGDLSRNYLLPTAVGAIRPTAVIPHSMVAGECVANKQMLLVGLNQLKDFWPELIAQNLSRTDLPGGGRVQARAAWLDLPARQGEADSSALRYATAMDDPRWRERFVAAVKPLVTSGDHVGLPAVLGLSDPGVHKELEARLGAPVFEIATVPPSIPGMRVNNALTAQARAERVRIVLGSPVVGAVTDDDRITGLTVATAGRQVTYPADYVVFAPGGFESGALTVDSYLTVHEPVLGLPVWTPEGQLVMADHDADQPLFRSGVPVDDQMRPIDAEGRVVYSNLRAAGGVLAGASRWREKSGEGIALASAMRAVDSIVGGSHE